jgi:lysosomal alpha-glucosidase
MLDFMTGKLTIKRKSNSKTIFSTELSQLIYSDQFLQLKSTLSSNNIYGIGEHKAPLLKSTAWKKYTLFNHDRPKPAETWPLYGSHPFHLNVEDSEGLSNGILLFNSNAMDIITQPQPAITWKPIGGILDFFIFLGPKPQDVIREYVSLIGKPALPPFWSLGYHQCRCCPAPHTLDEQKVIWKRTLDAEIPFDVQWNAKEYMINFNDFTVDNKTFGGFGDYVRHLHEIGMHYVPIIDPGIDPAQPTGIKEK